MKTTPSLHVLKPSADDRADAIALFRSLTGREPSAKQLAALEREIAAEQSST